METVARLYDWRYHNSSLKKVSWPVMEALRRWEKRHSCHKKKKKGGVNGSNGDVRMEVEGLLRPC